MNSHPLKLEKRDTAQHKAVAWFLGGGETVHWIESLSQWRGDQDQLELYVVPRSSTDRRPGGLLVIPPVDCLPPEGWRALALGVIEGRLFLPVDAEIFPPVNPAELRVLCRAEVTLFHPGLGIVEFSKGDRRRIWELLAAPKVVPENWNAARSDEPMSSRLRAISLLALPGEDEIFGDAGEDIGAQPSAKLPPSREEPSGNPISRAGRAATGLAMGALRKMIAWASSGSGSADAGGKPRSPNWVDAVMDWASAKLAKISRETEELRHRELHRLMEMLNSDPERGLRHALPFSGTPGRGRAAPGARLGSRDLRFNLSGGRAGGPVDPWDVPWELQQKLTARYRELAVREKQLGRFQRAAYIYAELLGDWNSAAAVLREGLHFAEAAMVYRDRLNQPLVAAECFAAGGLFQEALAIYEKENRFLELGDLQRKLGDEPAAEAAYWRVVERMTASGDLLGAASLLEDRLRSPDKALVMLGKAWPGAPQASLCLAEQFALLGRLERHDAAQRRVVELRDESTPVRLVIPLAEVLATVRKNYPDGALRILAADVARQKIGPRLAMGEAGEARAGTRILCELAPEDRLLARDASRFLAARLEVLARRTPPALPPPPRKPGANRVLAPLPDYSFLLENCGEIIEVKRCGQHFLLSMYPKRFLSGRSFPDTLDGGITVLRGNWVGDVQETIWKSEEKECNHASLVVPAQAMQPTSAVVLSGPELIHRSHLLSSTDVFPSPLMLFAPAWLPNATSVLTINSPHWWILRRSQGDWVVDGYRETGELDGSFSLGDCLAKIEDPASTVAMQAMRSQLWVAFGRHLFVFARPGQVARHWVCETAIHHLEASAPLLASAVIARCEMGAAIFWCDDMNDRVEMIGSDLRAPFAASLGNGVIVLLSSHEGPDGYAGLVIDIDRRGIHSQAEFSWKGDRPAGVVATDRQDMFAVFTFEGVVQLLSVPSADNR